MAALCSFSRGQCGSLAAQGQPGLACFFKNGCAVRGIVGIHHGLLAPLFCLALGVANTTFGGHVPLTFSLAIQQGCFLPAALFQGVGGQVLQASGIFLTTQAFGAITGCGG